MGLAVIATLVAVGESAAQLAVPEVSKVGKPIVAGCECSLPAEPYDLRCSWSASEGVHLLAFPEISDPLRAYVWATPNKAGEAHWLRVVCVTQQYTIREVIVDAKLVDGELVLTKEKLKVTGDLTVQEHRAEFRVVLEDEPEPPGPTPPGPEPGPSDCDDVPEDEFGNLGRRVCKWVGETVTAPNRGKRADLATLFETVATRLEDGSFLNISESNAYLRTERSKILSPQAVADDWAVFAGRLNEDLTLRRLSYADRQDLIAYYRAVAAGLSHKSVSERLKALEQGGCE